MGPRAVGVLAVLAVLLTAWCYLFERDHAPWEKPVGPVFPGLEYSDLERITITHGSFSQAPGIPSGPIVLLRRREPELEPWWIEKPAVPAFFPRVESIAHGLVELQAVADVPPLDAQRVFGDGGPEVTVEFRTRMNAQHTLEVGRAHPEMDLCYVRVDGERLILARQDFRRNLASRLDDLRSRALFPVPPDRVVKLEVMGDPRHAKVLRREGDSWRFESPEPRPGDRDALAGLLKELNSWGAEGFERDEEGDLAPFGLDRPRTTIAITDQKGVRTALEVGREVGGDGPEKAQVYVKWAGRPFVMRAAPGPLPELERSAENLYSEFALQLGPEAIVELAVERLTPPGGRFTLKRAPSPAKAEPVKSAAAPRAPEAPLEWTVEDGAARFPGDPDRARVLGDSLRHLPVKRYLPLAPGAPPGGSFAPALRIELLTELGGRRRLTLGKPLAAEEAEKKIVYIAVEGEPFIVQSLTPLLEELERGGAPLRDRRISGMDPPSLREMEITSTLAGKSRTWILARPQDSWKVFEGGEVRRKKPFEERLASLLVRRLAREELRVQEWMPPGGDMAEREIDPQRFRVRIRFLSGVTAGFRTFYLGSPRQVEGEPPFTWGRVDTEELKDLPFLVDAALARAVLDLVEHLDLVTETVE